MKWLLFACKNVLRNRRRSLMALTITAVGTAAALVGGGFALFTYDSLRELAAQLPGGRFQQVHRSTIVNLSEVAAAVKDESGKLSLRLRNRKEMLPVSRLYADLFKAM